MPKININMVKWLHDYLAIDKCQPNNIIFVERDMIITCCYTIARLYLKQF